MEKKINRNRRNTVGLTFANFGQCIFSSITSMALPMFFTDALYIAPAAVSLIFLITRIWDAINDPIMGMIVDKTQTKWGKCRPYLLFATIPLVLFTIILFIPVENKDVQFGYYLMLYLLFVTSYTALDIPSAGIKPLLFTDPDKRNKAMSISSTFGSLGSLLAIDLFFIFVHFLGGDNVKQGYFLTILFLSLLGGATLIVSFFTTKEVIPTVSKRASILASMKVVAKNKPLLFVILTTLFGVGVNGYGMMLPYFAKWNLADGFSFGQLSVAAVMIPILSTVTGVIYMVAIFITPFLLKWVSKKKLFIIMSIGGAVFNAASFFAGYSNIYVFCIIRFFAHIPPTVNGALCGFMLADTLDLAEYKTGERTEGASYAFNNLINNTGGAIFSSVALFLLGVFGYSASVAEPALEIGESISTGFSGMLDGIFIIMTVLPAISMVIQLIPMFFFKLDEKQHAQIIAELEVRRAAVAVEAVSEVKCDA